MIEGSSFTGAEAVPFYALVITVLAIIAYGYFRDYSIFWSPLTIVAIIFGYYCCLGPYDAVSNNETFDRLINMRKYYPSALWGAWVSLVSIAIGFLVTNRSYTPKIMQYPGDDVLFTWGRRIVVVSTILFAISSGGNLFALVNPLDAEAVQATGGGFSNYLVLSINFMIVALCLLFVYWYRTKKQFLWFFIPFVAYLGIYISIGFRYRVILLLSSLAITYYMSRKRKPNVIIGGALVIALIAFMGIINISRNYGQGLNTDKLEGNDSKSYYRSGLREAMIFQTSGAVIDNVPKKHSFVGFAPVVSTVFFPIPQRFYPEKNSAWYIVTMLRTIYGPKHFKGGAFMAYAEHYLSFGWTGIVVWGLLIGWVYKRVWLWYKANSNNLLCIVAYAATVSYIYVILSRGYLPQVTMLFFFSIFPAFIVIYFVNRRAVPRLVRS